MIIPLRILWLGKLCWDDDTALACVMFRALMLDRFVAWRCRCWMMDLNTNHTFMILEVGHLGLGFCDHNTGITARLRKICKHVFVSGI